MTNATQPTASPATEFDAQQARKAAAMRRPLLGLSEDDLRQTYFDSLLNRGWAPNGFGMVEVAGIVAEGREQDGPIEWKAARVWEPAVFAAQFGEPVTHERALQVLQAGLLTAAQQQDAQDQFDRWLDDTEDARREEARSEAAYDDLCDERDFGDFGGRY